MPVANGPHVFLWPELIESEWLNVEETKFIALKAFPRALRVACVYKIISGKWLSRKFYVFAPASKTTEAVNAI